MHYIRSINIITGIFIVLMVSSCMTERKLASQFVMKEANINVLILPPPGLVKKFYSTVPGTAEPDSLVTSPIEQSKFLENLNDTAFVNYYFRSLRYYLDLYQVKVYNSNNIDAFFQLDSNAYLFTAAQIELLETSDKYRDVGFYDTLAYRIALPRTTVEKSVWFEFSELNRPDQPMEVYYSMQQTSDFFDGQFYWNWRTGEMTYRHTPYYVEDGDVYDLAYFAGKKNAQYIFDLIMNKYIAEHIKRPRRNPVFYQYDVERHLIRRANDDRFIQIPQNQETGNP